jgi:hypothetical protein
LTEIASLHPITPYNYLSGKEKGRDIPVLREALDTISRAAGQEINDVAYARKAALYLYMQNQAVLTPANA